MTASSGRSGDDLVLSRREVLAVAAMGLAATALPAGANTPGQMTFAVHVALTPSWFDPAESTGIITPYLVMYALHDAIVKAMPGQIQAPSLAETVSVAKDGRTFDFVLRQNALFHNGEPVTAEDVKFSYLRYRGAESSLLKQRVDKIETLSPPYPDQVEGTMARFSDLLRGRHGGRMDRSGEVRDEGWRSGFQESSDRRRTVQIRLVHAGE